MSDEKPEALLKSALEKIVYFEARASQLTNDADGVRGELERVKADLAAASQREIELRRVIAELEVRATRAHSEREETARVVDALRRERAELVGKMLEASRIHGVDQGIEGFDLSQFIAQLRQEVLLQREGAARAPAAVSTASTVADVANELKSQGRLQVTASDLATLTGAREFPGRSEETLFGFSVRELAAPDASARVRAAERLEALRHPAAAPALATALHGETEGVVQVALLSALSSLAKAEAAPVVTPLLTSPSPEVRIAALKALIKVDAAAAGPHLAAATKDPDKAVRRRASLLALGLSGSEALELGRQAIRDVDADVRALASLVLGASSAEVARPLLMDAMKDADVRVRRAASQSLSRLLGQDVTSLVSLDDAHRRREVRRLHSVPSAVPPLSLSPRAGSVAEPTPSATMAVDARPAHVAQPSAAQQFVGSPAHTAARRAMVASGPAVTPSAAQPSVAQLSQRAVMPSAQQIVASATQRIASVASDPAVTPSAAPPSAQQFVAVPAHTTARIATVASDPAVTPSAAPPSVQQFVAVAAHATARIATVAAAPQRVASPAHMTPTVPAPAVMQSLATSPQFGAASAPAAWAGPMQHPAAPVVAHAQQAAAARATVAFVDAPEPAPHEQLGAEILRELRAAIRGKPLADLASSLHVAHDDVMRACGDLIAQGAVVRRGIKYFVA